MNREQEIRRVEREIAAKQQELAALQEAKPAGRSGPSPPGAPAASGAAAFRFSVIGVVFLMGLGIAALVGLQEAPRWQQLVVGGSLAGGLVVMGWVGRHRHRALSELLLGAGLAACYLAAYALFAAAAQDTAPSAGMMVWPLAATCVVVFAIAAHGRGSRTAAAIGLVFVYYSVYAASFAPRTEPMLSYALATAGALALSVLGLSLFRPWRLLHGAALVLNTILFFAVFDAARWSTLEPPLPPIWLGAVAAVQYVAFGLADAFEERRRTSRLTAWFAGFNIAACLFWTLRAAATWIPDHMAAAEFSLAGASFVLAAAAYGLLGGRTWAGRLYGAAAIVLAAGTAWELLPLSQRGPVFGCVALALAACWRIGGGRTLFILQVGAALLAMGAAARAMLDEGAVQWLGWQVPGRWFSTGLTAALLLAASWCGERFHRHGDWHAKRRTQLDGAADARLAGLSSLCFAGAAGLLLAFGAAYAGWPGSHPAPLGLAMAAGGIAVAAAASRTGPLLLPAAMVLAVAHLLVYASPLLEDQQAAASLGGPEVAVLALMTYAAGMLWERFVHSFAWRTALGEYAVEALPAFAATGLVCWRFAAFPHTALWQTGLGAVLVFAGGLLARPALLWAGLAALTGAAGLFFWRLETMALLPVGPFYTRLLALLAAGIFAERMLAWTERRQAHIHRFDDMVRTLIVASVGAAGVLALNRRAPDEVLTLSWAGLAAALMLAGLALREGRHRWAASLVGALALIRLFFHDLDRWPVAAQAIGFATSLGAAFALLHFSLQWFRKRRWTR